MNTIKKTISKFQFYVQAKENLSKEVGELTDEIFLRGMDYEEALKEAREMVEKDGGEKMMQ